MTLTTPPRPYDILKHFPGLAPYAKSAVRLHPRRGAPGIDQSSIGGPLLWPADEPWPVCGLSHEPGMEEPFDGILRHRVAEGSHRWCEPELQTTREAPPSHDRNAPVPLIPVAQLYYRDVPGLPWADRYDLLQILWCPLDHTGTRTDTPYCPAFQIRWRRTEEVHEKLAVQPRPVMCVDEYVPNPCVVCPEVVTEYPNISTLPEALRRAIGDWEDQTGNSTAYSQDIATAPGWKVMGHGGYWGIIDPYPMMCECGEEQLPLFTAASGEFDGGTRSWRPSEEAESGRDLSDPVGVTIGRGYALQLYYCPTSEHHANRTEMS